MKEIPITFDPKVNDFDGLTHDEGGRLHRADVAPGASWWVNGNDGAIACLRFACPCGCGLIGATPVRAGFGSGQWQWNGNKEKPSLTPSILFSSGCPNKWHGYLTDGMWVPC